MVSRFGSSAAARLHPPSLSARFVEPQRYTSSRVTVRFQSYSPRSVLVRVIRTKRGGSPSRQLSATSHGDLWVSLRAVIFQRSRPRQASQPARDRRVQAVIQLKKSPARRLCRLIDEQGAALLPSPSPGGGRREGGGTHTQCFLADRGRTMARRGASNGYVRGA